MGRWAYEDEILCLHNNTYSAAFRRVEYGLTLPNHFRAMGAAATFLFFAHFRRNGRAKRLHKGLLLLRLLSLHKKHKHFLQASSLLAVATPLSRRALIRGWCANLSRIPIEPAPSALMGLPQKKTGGGGQSPPPWLAVNHCHSLRAWPSACPAALRGQRRNWALGEAKVFPSKLQKFNLGRITQEDGAEERLSEPGTVPRCRLYLLKCEKLIKAPGFPDETV